MILGGFPPDYDWHEHDKRVHAARMKLDARWATLRDYLPVLHRLARGLPVIPLDQHVLQSCVQLIVEELVFDMSETAAMQFRHRDRPEPPAEPTPPEPSA